MSDPGQVRPKENILLFHDERATYLIPYKPRGRFECHLGLVEFPESLKWGQTLETNTGTPMAVLRPSHSEIMTLLKRRTTVVYPKEAGQIVMALGVYPGGRFAECGSGSGAMTTVLAQLVGETGRIFSFDRDADHQAQAQRNVDRMGLGDRVEFTQSDPGRDGWGVTDLDGVFIDVPAPWDLVPSAARALKGGAVWVSLSPTVEQVTRTERALWDAGFARRRMSETFVREWKLFPGRMRPTDRMVGHTAFLLTANLIGDRRLLKSEQRRRR